MEVDISEIKKINEGSKRKKKEHVVDGINLLYISALKKVLLHTVSM